MNKIKNAIKENNDLYCLAVKAKNRIPRKLYYPKDYFKIKRMLDSNNLNIDEFRNERLCNLLKEALEYVPYYKKLNLGILSEDITEENAFEMLQKFPYIDKKTVIENADDFVNIKFNKDKLIHNKTSGSTGPGIDLWRTRREELLEKSFFDYKWGKLGYKDNSKIVRMAVEGIKKDNEYPCSYVGDKMIICPNHLNYKCIDEIFNKIKEFKPAFFHCYPSSFQYLLQYMKENNLNLDNVQGIFLASEAVNKDVLNLSQLVFKNVPIIFHYGLSERSNLAWGIFQNNEICYKCDDIYGYSENIINEDGLPEIVGTSYWNYAMPLIRYNTHDIGKIENGIISNLQGRVEEFLITKHGDKIHGINIDMDDYTWKYVDIVQIVQNEPGKIEIHVKPKDSFNLDVKEKILKSKRAEWGNMFDILLVIDNRISKTKSGKVRYIINNIR
ncbi:phenylacetate--CoA ligase family protein [Clostridium sp. JN-9]|uniref:phenylacetate--CoA ligase family protein n=1 Tax=Clostridium sp. JN-9 TaxID=2507159 RepID=UPI00196B3A06|nr:phenylacetate--CoA ligase family protein [Clostridium sp. JN-9]